MKYMFSLLFVLVSSIGYTQNKSKPITELSQNEIKSVMLVDVRTPEEFEAGHIEGAINMNWFNTDFIKQFESVDKEQSIYVYCKKGGRSAKAQQKLVSLGYIDIVNLEGGYDAYVKR